jgi:hypothetical protein
MQQRHQYPATRATKCVSKCNSTSPWVDVVGTQTEDLGVGFDDGSEGLVELPDGDVFLLEPGLLEQFLDAGGGGDGEVDGVWIMLVYESWKGRRFGHTDCSIGVGDDLG